MLIYEVNLDNFPYDILSYNGMLYDNIQPKKKGNGQMKYIKVEKLEEGMTVAITLYGNNANVLLTANNKLTKTSINRLKLLGFKGIYIYDKNNETYSSLLSDSTRKKALTNLNHMNIDGCLYVANQITNELINNKDMVFDLLSISSFDNATFNHSINVAITSTMVGVVLGFDNDTLKLVSQAALLHDLGKTAIDPAIINKEGDLTDEEFEIVKNHPWYGFNILQHHPSVPAVVRAAVYSHHENEDGTGYPRGVTGNKIHIIAKIIHVCDVYDALVSKRSYKSTMNPADAFEYILSYTGTKFDTDIVNAFQRCIAFYPIGVDVILSTEETATVAKNHKNFPARPTVITESGKSINLMEQLNVTIIDIIEE